MSRDYNRNPVLFPSPNNIDNHTSMLLRCTTALSVYLYLYRSSVPVVNNL